MTQPDPDHKVTICHATSSESNPFTSPEVDVASIFSKGHDHHDHQGVEDIIPPFSYTDAEGVTQSYPGKGDQSILENGCRPVVPTTTTTTSTTTTSCPDCVVNTVVENPTTTTTTLGGGVPVGQVPPPQAAQLAPPQSVSRSVVEVPVDPAVESLAFTGVDTGMLAVVGTALLAAGVLMRRVSVRRV